MRGVNIMCNQLRVIQTARFLRYLLCGLVTFLLLNGLAWSAESANKLVSVSVDTGAATPTILVKTADPVGYRYTVYDSFEPTRVVIDFPGMVLTDIDEMLAVNLGAVQEVRVAGFDLSSGKLARVEILLSENTEYQVNLESNEFRVAFATSKDSTEVVKKPEIDENISVDANQEAKVLKNISLSPGQAVLETNGKVSQHQYFALSNPPRLVVDVYGVRPAFKERSFLTEAGFSKVRVGTYTDKTRLVFDASGKTLPEHLVEGRDTDILVSWGGSKPAVGSDVAQTDTKMLADAVEAAPVTETAPVVSEMKPVEKVPTLAKGPVAIEAIDFTNEEGRSVITLALSGEAKVSAPVEDGNLMRFEIVDASISRALRRTIDASAFPSAVTSVTPYTVAEGDHQNVRIAVSLKGPVAYALEQEGRSVRLVVDDGAYAEPVPPAVSQVEVVAPVASADKDVQVAMGGQTTGSLDAQIYDENEKISLDFIDANIRNLLRLIADVSNLNIVASDNVKGNMTLRLVDVPWKQALDLILTTNGLRMKQDGNIVRIMTNEEFNTFQQEDIDAQVSYQDSAAKLTVRESVKIQNVNMESIEALTSTFDKVEVRTNKATKSVVLIGSKPDVEALMETIAEIDKPEQQVMIEVRIVEAKTDNVLDFGVRWGSTYRNDGAEHSRDLSTSTLGVGGVFAIAPPSIGDGNFNAAGGALGMNFGILGVTTATLNMRLSALESNGDVKVVSTPKILTLNGNPASITQGRQIPYTTTSADGGSNTEFKDAKLNLTVTPEINPNGTIILDLDLANDTQGPNVATGDGQAPAIDTKTAKTKLIVNDGDTTVIGGIFVDSEDESEAGVPLLKDIPFFGHAFKSTSRSKSRSELLIFITPRIIEAE